jgi:nucleoid-associated protein YgaU
MTRETKIGLLVGLAFIIVIGILLSDHLSSSTEPPPATLANAGSNVMQTITSPGSAAGAQAQPVVAPQVQPNTTVPLAGDLARPQQQPVQIVQVGTPPPRQEPIAIQAQQPDPAPAATATPQPETYAGDAPIITHVPAQTDDALNAAARRSGESLVALDSTGRPQPNVAPVGWTQALTGMTEYKAEPGDSVSKMAMKFLGGNTKTNRDLIVKANPSLQKDPNKVIVGQTYLIPSATERTAAISTIVEAPAAPAMSPTVASATEYWYTVKENDSLWKIATEQLGNPNAVAAIKELNQIQDENRIAAGMKLKLPGKPLAQAR